MNTLQESKGRLRMLLAALMTIRDNYGITSAQSTNFAIAKDELEDIIANMADVPPPEPVTVDGVVDKLVERLNSAQAAAFNEIGGLYDAVMSTGEKVDALIALANKAGEPAAA
jgi:hypothetical protein